MRMNSSDEASCAAALRGGSRSFHAASRLLPARVRGPATALYAFCRDADDAIDHAAAAGRAPALVGLHARLEAIHAGAPLAFAADRAFAEVVAAHDIPRALPLALLEGFAWDAEGRRYDTLAELECYAARVAGTVGVMMAIIMGVRDAATLARAAELGVAMQLTNIARDVGEDARAGRLYLPLVWLEEAEIEPATLLERAQEPGNGSGRDAGRADCACMRREEASAVGAVVARLLDRSRFLYARAARGVADLPADCRPAIHAARLLYAGIGEAAGRPRFDPMARRAVMARHARAIALARALVASCADTIRPTVADAACMAPAVLPLVQAAIVGGFAPRRHVPAWRRVEAKAVWVLELFATLDARDRSGAA